MKNQILIIVGAALIISLVPGCGPSEAEQAATATSQWNASETRKASYFQTKTAEPTSTPRPTVPPKPTNTPDLRSPFEKCVQSGQGVRYVIFEEGVSAVSLTWENDTGGTEQGDYKVPYCKTYTGFKRGDFLYISAQIIKPTSGAGSIKCRIYDGNTIVAEANASGFASIATCSGSAK
jgi:hypothetical protein